MTSAARQPPHIRRIVTGHDASGKAIVWMDGPATNHRYPFEKASTTLLWVTDETPSDYLAREDPGNRTAGTAPPPGGTRFAFFELQPGSELQPLHRTDTVDYIVCISGSVEMALDDSFVTMNAGDVMIQRGTNHAWLNRGTEPARLAVVLTDGKPKRAGSLSGAQQAR
jgi:quercetin dioxygenase-like cupin family protein